MTTTRERTLTVLLLSLLLAACGEPPPPEWHEEDDHRWRELRVPDGEDTGFTPVEPGRAGIEFANAVDTEDALDNEHLLIGSGVSLGDVDGDGRTDVYLTRLEGPNALYRNLGGWRFREITDSAGVAAAGRHSTGSAMADLDGDGDLDLVVGSLGGPDVVYRNDGSGRFSETRAGLEPGLGTSTLTLADVDGDGDLDLYRTAYKAESASDVLRMLERAPSELNEEIARERGDSMVIAPEYRDHYRMEEREGRRVAVEQADPDRLYLNDGTGRFEPVSWTGGRFRDAEGRPLERAVDDFGLAARFYDVDRDGDPDLYVCNDFHDPDQLWINQGDGTFRAAPRFALRTTSHASMSVDFSDIDVDGHTDFFVAEMQARSRRRRLLEIPFHGPHRKPPGIIDDRPQVQRNTLFLNRGDGTFAEIARLAGVEASDWTWASMFLDVDLDGYEDLLIANGYSRDTQHGDIARKITELGGQATTRELKRLYPELRNRNVAFRNRGDLTFRDTGREWGVGTEADISHGMASGDLDGDGDLDVVVNRLGDPVRLLRNDASGPRVTVRLRAPDGNTRGVGARIRLEGGPVGAQQRQITAGGLYLSSPAPRVTFAAGDADSLRLEVEWPDGRRSVIPGVRPDRLYEVRPPAPGRDGPDRERTATDPLPLFTDRTPLLGHRHPEASFEDYRRQPLLPYRPGRLGPGVSWMDVDGDGDPDLVVPPGGGGRLSYLRNDGDGFTQVALEDTTARLDRTAAVPLPSEGDAATVVVGQSNYQASSIEEARTVPAALRAHPDSAGPVPLVPGVSSATGPVATADVDGDGDLDLFVGGRTLKGAYPLPASSRLFRNEDGRFTLDRRNREVLEDVGMVSGAVFSDLDRDGDPDLVLALEWRSIRVLENDDGVFTDRTAEWGLDRLRGRWNGIDAGDLDGDGRMDLVVTGRGRNVRHRPAPGRPLVLYNDDLDRNGTWDLLLAQAREEGGPIRPLDPYYLLRRAVPSLRSRISSFEGYADADLATIFGREPRKVYRMVARRYEHLLLLNRGDRFDVTPLPVEAQFAPATGVTVGDLDGDGREDVFLSQNFFPVSVDEARHNTGLGLVLLGDGDGGLDPLSPTRSGIRIHGDQRGAALADYDGDGRVDLAVAQNGAATRLFQNTGAEPGLRVRLRGTPGNPRAVGAVIRVVYADGTGPAREVHGGSGYWSMDSAVQVMGLRSDPEAVRVRWPGDEERRVPVPDGTRTITVRRR